MKVWIDILTPKQLLYFKPLAEELLAKGGEALCTSRRYREVSLLAEKIGFHPEFLGRHGGAALEGKLEASVERTALLAKYVKERRPDCAVSFGSPECARVAFGLKVPHVCINDSPHAESVARLTIPLSDWLLTPWVIPYAAWTKFGIERGRIERYRALDPAAWLKRMKQREAGRPELPLRKGREVIVVRSEESAASYLLSTDSRASAPLIGALVNRFPEADLVVLCRYREQVEDFTGLFGSKIIVPRNVVLGVSLLAAADVFIGMGGTMTAEAALLGVPTISAYPGGELYVERYLVEKGLVVKARGATDVLKAAESLLADREGRARLRGRAERLLKGMEDPTLRVLRRITAVASKAEKT